MANSGLVRFGLYFLACLTVSGCAQPPYYLSATERQGLAGRGQKIGWWDRLKSMAPAASVVAADSPKLKNPGKLHLAYARWHDKMGDFVSARESYELALGEDPKSVDAMLGLARLDQLNGRTYEAEQGYQKALKLKPNDAHVLNAAGQFYASQEHWEDAIAMLNRALVTDPQEPTYRYNLAIALARSGQIDAALPHITRVVGDAQAHYNVGYIIFEQGDLVSAERQFLQAVIKHPDLIEAQQMLDEVRRLRKEQQMYAQHTPPNSQGWGATEPALGGGPQPTASGYSQVSAQKRQFHSAVPTIGPQLNLPTGGDQLGFAQRHRDVAKASPQHWESGASQTGLNVTPPAWHTAPAIQGGSASGSHSASIAPINQSRGFAPSTRPGQEPPVSPEQREQQRNQRVSTSTW